MSACAVQSSTNRREVVATTAAAQLEQHVRAPEHLKANGSPSTPAPMAVLHSVNTEDMLLAPPAPSNICCCCASWTPALQQQRRRQKK
jgi:hypothetical protein